MPGDADIFCVDCRATGTQPPRLPEGRSPRCPDHHKQRSQHLAKGRQARRRASSNPDVTAPTPAEWETEYTPQRLPTAHVTAVLLDANDLEEISAVVTELRATMDQANNAYRREDDTATRLALRDLLDRTYEAITVLEDIPGVPPQTR